MFVKVKQLNSFYQHSASTRWPSSESPDNQLSTENSLLSSHDPLPIDDLSMQLQSTHNSLSSHHPIS